jgi:hypothetical protein
MDSSIKNTVAVESTDFEKIVKTYVEKNKPYVCILTPCYGAVCFIEYVTSLIATMNVCSSVGIRVKVEFCRNDSLVSRARNNLVARALGDKEVTHVLFIDADIIWDPVSIMKLLVADKGLIGGIYPLKNYFWDKLSNNTGITKTWIDAKNASQLKNLITDKDLIQHKLLNYNLNLLPTGLSIENNIGKVRHIATGFMMIKREVFDKMFVAFPSTKYTDDVSFLRPEENKYAYALFDCGVEDDHYYSEDWMFCSRWSKMGGEIWVDISINLTHIGIERYHGNYLSQLIADR